MIRDIIWDFDGTLFDTYPGAVNSFKRALKDCGIDESDENILNYIKVSEGHAVAYFREFYGLNDTFIDKLNLYKKNIELNLIKPFPFAVEFCKEFAALGGRNYIITHRGKSTEEILDNHGILEFFTEVIIKQSGFKRKPDPEAFLYLIEKYNINKNSALVVGDRELEILSGKAAGIYTCLYNTNNIEFTETPNYYIDSLKKLEDVINF